MFLPLTTNGRAISWDWHLVLKTFKARRDDSGSQAGGRKQTTVQLPSFLWPKSEHPPHDREGGNALNHHFSHWLPTHPHTCSWRRGRVQTLSCSRDGRRLQAGWPRGAACSWAGSPRSPRRASHQHPANQPTATDVVCVWDQMCLEVLPCCLLGQAARAPASTTLCLGMERAQHGESAEPRGKGIREAFPDYAEVNSFKAITFISQSSLNTSIQPEKALDLLAIILYSHSFCPFYRTL